MNSYTEETLKLCRKNTAYAHLLSSFFAMANKLKADDHPEAVDSSAAAIGITLFGACGVLEKKGMPLRHNGEEIRPATPIAEELHAAVIEASKSEITRVFGTTTQLTQISILDAAAVAQKALLAVVEKLEARPA